MTAPTQRYNVLIVGGGPAGSSAARELTRRGKRVLVLDRAQFPRVKLCAGWLSEPVWKALRLHPQTYPLGLWRWHRCHVHYRGKLHTVDAKGYFIRRVEFDDWLLSNSGADVHTSQVKTIVRRDGDWVIDGRWSAPYVIGAGGTHCPVARQLFAPKPDSPVGCQELEFQVSPEAIARTRAGRDGEPELLLHQDLSGYSWNIPKTDWLNVGAGTVDARSVRSAWTAARALFEAKQHLPPTADAFLDKPKGHSYYLFDARHLDDCQRDGALLVGDSLGLAQPLTAEGILPAVLSGRIAAECIADGAPQQYPQRLAAHSVMRDYALIQHLRDRVSSRAGDDPTRPSPRRPWDGLSNRLTAKGFAWMFSGKPLPARRLIARFSGIPAVAKPESAHVP